MTAKIVYQFAYRDSELLPDAVRKSGQHAWIIERCTEDGFGTVVDVTDIAIFNLDSAAMILFRHLYCDGKIKLDEHTVDLFALQDKNRARSMAKCQKCFDTGIHETGNNDLPCTCSIGHARARLAR